MSITTINSDTKIIDIDSHFKVSAGPGAGKTYWLINHIKNVLHNSEKLFRTRKIACITYTNIAVETILKRLGTSSEQVEVSTIHSFLYKNIVKPYAIFIASEFGLNVAEMDGHDDIILSNYSFLQEWKTRTGQQRINDDKKVVEAFSKLKWKIESGVLKVKTDYPILIGKYPIKNDSYLEYKKMMWGKGLIHHDDVLFFSFQIINKFPFVLNILNAKFPYIFIDEFQDSNPIQVEIFKKLGILDSKIGLIGDVAQSIYKFQGADYTQFQTFSLPAMNEYILNENHRSSNEIIDTLNSIRKDITQVKIRDISVAKPIIFIGDMTLALRAAKIKCSNERIYTLSRNNITSNAMKAEINGSVLDSKLLEKLKEIDSNTKRSNLIYSSIKAIAYAKENKFKDAIKEFERLFNHRSDKIKGKRKALKYITILLDKYSEFENGTLLEFADFVRTNLKPELTKLSKGAIKEFYENNALKKLLLCVSIPEDMSLHKTIHKAKGDEFDNVLLVLKDEKDIDFIFEQNLLSNEEHRINYVAISRAKNRLFISVPIMSSAIQTSLQTYYEIENV
jgi:DNA helicase-2/ATP-dependent DNA helicase PcrA